MTEIKVQIITWNVGSADPLEDKELHKLLQLNSTHPVDVYGIYLQEIETGLVETAKSFVSYDDWTKSLMKFLSNHHYYLVKNVRVQGITMSVFARLVHLPYIRYIKTDIERTGALASTWGNKGGVAISCSIYSHTICFLNTHLAAHLADDAERIADFEEVIHEIDFDGTTTVFEHEIVFWAGDLNFRIENLERDEVEAIAKGAGPYEKLLQNDQLKKHLKQKCAFAQFTEGPVTFAPTYKFDRGTQVYDTSEKQRKPAYTDRILHRVNPAKSFIHDMVLSELSADPSASYAGKLINQVPDSYKSLSTFTLSDHKPVTAQYIVSITDQPAPLVELRIGNEINDTTYEVDITYYHGMVADGRDYLALYDENMLDASSYKTTKTLDETTETEVKEKFHKICRFSSQEKIEKQEKFRIGYFSNKLNCLLALTEPFVIKC